MLQWPPKSQQLQRRAEVLPLGAALHRSLQTLDWELIVRHHEPAALPSSRFPVHQPSRKKRGPLLQLRPELPPPPPTVEAPPLALHLLVPAL